MRGRIPTILTLLVLLALLPLACVYRARATLSPLPRIHLIQGMDNQPRFKSQQVNLLFADTREERPPVEGTIARGRLAADEGFSRGLRDGKWLETVPVPVNEALMHRGRERFNIYCSPCHGLAGYGDGIVALRADRLQEGTWVPPSSLHSQSVVERPAGHLFNTITNGIRTMPSYGSQIPEADRWAIVMYVRALQLSQRAPAAVLSADERSRLREVTR